jgi:hypothetical protein
MWSNLVETGRREVLSDDLAPVDLSSTDLVGLTGLICSEAMRLLGATVEGPGHGGLPLSRTAGFTASGPVFRSACSHYPCPCLATEVGDGEWDPVFDAGRNHSAKAVVTVGQHVDVMAERGQSISASQ